MPSWCIFLQLETESYSLLQLKFKIKLMDVWFQSTLYSLLFAVEFYGGINIF